MKKLKIISATALLLILALVIVNYNLLSTADEQGDLPPTINLEKDISMPLGTSANPFVILEIVPHKTMSEIGYMIPGCEPIDMEKLMKDRTYSGLVSGYNSKFYREGNPEQSVADVTAIPDTYEYCFSDEIEAGEIVSAFDTKTYDANGKKVYDGSGAVLMDQTGISKNESADNYTKWQFNDSDGATKTLTGYYEKVEDNTACFQLVETTSAALDVSGQATGVVNSEFSFKFVGLNQGNYRWVTAEKEGNITTDYRADKVWTERTWSTYYSRQIYNGYNYVHHDDMIQTIFEVGSEEVEKMVITVTPYDFVNENNLELIDLADMIYIHRAHDNGSIVDLWVALNKEGETLTDKKGNEITAEQAKATTFVDNDLPWPAVLAIVDRMSWEDPAALIMDSGVVGTDSTSDNNCHKLALMLRQYGPKVFTELYLDTGLVVESEDKREDGLTTGIYNKKVGDEVTSIVKWDQATFRPDIPNHAPEYLIEYGMKDPYFTSSWLTIEDNIYINNGDKTLLDDFLVSGITEGSKNGEAFDYFEDLYGKRPTSLTANEVIKFLLQDISKKRKLKLLEVQPCNEFIYGSDDWEAYYLTMFTWFEGDLEKDVIVDTMTTAQFISDITDLNSEYDAIIFGTKQNVSNGGNGYFDTSMNTRWENGINKGLAYTSIGDIVSSTAQVDKNNNPTGYHYFESKEDRTDTRKLYSDKSMRYSGTDITAKKLEELKSYMNAGKPIILDRSCVNRWGSKDPDTTLIDKDSYMYQLVDMYEDDTVVGVDTSKLFVRGLYQSNKLKRALAVETCKIQFNPSDGGTGYPQEYSYTPVKENGYTGTISDVTYSPTRTFEYTFKIVGKTGQKYGISLYIDVNGDGRYEGSLKEMDEIQDGTETDITESASKQADSEKVTGIVVRDRNGYAVNPSELYANVTYTLTKELEETYQGILPWKLEAHKADNTFCRSNVVRYSAVKSSTGEKEEIKVLLMNLTPRMTTKEQFYKENTNINSKKLINMADTDTDVGKKFQQYISCVDEYDVQLTFLENPDWMNMFDPNGEGFTESAIQNNADNISAWKQYLDGYDMLILGFNDDCTYTSNYIYNEGFKYFVNCGKSVIMSHDMVRGSSSQTPFLTNFDEDLRQLMAQRRYYGNKVKMNGQEISLLGDNTSKYAVTINDGTADVQVPATYNNATRLFVVFGNKYKADRDTFTNNDRNWGSGEATTQYINVINQGQITNYPYKINDMIKVATTHGQNFQLDMENEDMVVWYGLTDKYSETYAEELKSYIGKNYAAASDKLGRGIYSSIEGDGRNSFYIYNVGNITYTGLGHSGDMTNEEVQLFVNTMISAYRRAAAMPKIEVTNEDAIINGDEVTLYIAFDDSNFNTDNEYLDVYFKVVDPSLVTIAGRSYILQYKDENGNVIAETTYDKRTNAKVGNNTTSTFVQVDGEYYFKVPYSKVRNNGRAEYELVLKSTYVDAENNTIETESTTKVYVLPMPLFTLN